MSLRRGFTLIEMMAVVVFTGVLLTAAVNFYMDVSHSSEAAMERTRAGRRAVGVLDRVARDLENTILVKKPEDVDPLDHPWIFVAEPRSGGLGADQLKFVSRGHRPRADDERASDLETVAYVLVPSLEIDGAFDLVRWSRPRLPEGLDRSFPGPDDEGSFVLAEGIGGFGVRMLDEEGNWVDRWDSSQLTDSSELPVAVEILVSAPADPRALGDLDVPEPPVFSRQVAIPVRPLDLEALLAGAEPGDDEDDDEDDDADCVTVAECEQKNPQAFQAFRALPGNAASLDGLADECAADHSLPPGVVGCDE